MTRDPASNSNDRHLSKNVHAVPARDSLAVEEDLHAPSLAFSARGRLLFLGRVCVANRRRCGRDARRDQRRRANVCSDMTSDVLLLLLFVLFLFLRWAICGSSELTTIEQNQKKKNTSVTRSILSQVRSGLEADFQQTLLVDEVKNDPVHVAVLWQRLEAFLVSLLVVSVPVLRKKTDRDCGPR